METVLLAPLSHFRFAKVLARATVMATCLLSGVALVRGAVQFSAGETAYVVARPETELEKRLVGRLTGYLEKVLGKPAQVVTGLDRVPARAAAIVLAKDGNGPEQLGLSAPTNSPEAYALETRETGGHAVVVAVGHTGQGLKGAIQRLILKSEQRAPGLVIPPLQLAESPWIPQRESAICAWDPQFARGVWFNPNADKRLNTWLYSDQQIADYVEMYDWFGFSGMQLLEGCNSFYDRGSPEAFQSVLKKYAQAARANGQNVTYWVWAAQFDNYGWVDPSVIYKARPGLTAFNDPLVRATFEKYYNHYAEMAPYVDTLVAHYYDPGQLKRDRIDMFDYFGLLREKFKARNPNITFSIDLWNALARGRLRRGKNPLRQRLHGTAHPAWFWRRPAAGNLHAQFLARRIARGSPRGSQTPRVEARRVGLVHGRDGNGSGSRDCM